MYRLGVVPQAATASRVGVDGSFVLGPCRGAAVGVVGVRMTATTSGSLFGVMKIVRDRGLWLRMGHWGAPVGS